MVKKNCEVWRKMGLLGPDSDPANQLLIFNKANFAVECGRFGEKFNAVKNKIGQLQPKNQSLNKNLEINV
jgi:hypothetical protein